MVGELEGKVAIITGASGGIGLATAQLFNEKGARVVLAARSAEAIETEAQKLPGSIAIPTDMRDLDAVRELIAQAHAHYGRVDILINNAGQGMGGAVESFDVDEFRSVFELNVVSVVVAMQAVIPLMREQGGGSIVNISSGLTKTLRPGVGPYAATKAMLDKLSHTARVELEKDGIAVSVVHPFITQTGFFANAAGGGHGGSEAVPSGADTPEYVAELILQAVQTKAPEVVAEKVRAFAAQQVSVQQ
ncbi:SDR family oxidoreductase [bacterium]|nr:MAG: SDR family oxidoreductase [bacterium]